MIRRREKESFVGLPAIHMMANGSRIRRKVSRSSFLGRCLFFASSIRPNQPPPQVEAYSLGVRVIVVKENSYKTKNKVQYLNLLPITLFYSHLVTSALLSEC